MKVLMVYSGNTTLGISPFVSEQAKSLEERGIDVFYFPISGKGILGYCRSILLLRKYLKTHSFDLIHGHFIWSILVCLFQRRVPVIGTFHGTDMYDKRLYFIARYFALTLLKKAIVVNKDMARKLSSRKVVVIPCGVDTTIFYPIAHPKLIPHHLIDKEKANILFCSRFDRYEKNYPLAEKAISLISNSTKVNVIELSGLERSEVNQLLNQVEMLLLTSFWEGSPQVVKEAMACNCPIVTTDVGDVRWLLQGVSNCEISGFSASSLAMSITKILHNQNRTNGRERILKLNLDNRDIADRIIAEYNKVLCKL